MRRACLALALVACRSRGSAPSAVVEDAAPPADSAVFSPKPRVVEAPAPLTADDRASAKRYAAALGEGRKATRAKKWSEARAAFGRALAERRDDARALAERGYANLLAGELDAASADIDRALVVGAFDAKLEAAVYYNRGLVEEKRGRPEEAFASFATAHALDPTPARELKIVGHGAACTPEGAAKPFAVERYADFGALAEQIAPVVDLGDAKKSVCVQSHTADGVADRANVCDGPWPWTLDHHHLTYTEDEWVVWPDGAALWAVPLGRVGSWPARCTVSPQTDLARVHGLVVLRTKFDGEGAGMREEGSGAEGEVVCGDVLSWSQEQWIDPRGGRTLLTLRFFPGLPRPTVEVRGDAIVVKGAGCDRTIQR